MPVIQKAAIRFVTIKLLHSLWEREWPNSMYQVLLLVCYFFPLCNFPTIINLNLTLFYVIKAL